MSSNCKSISAKICQLDAVDIVAITLTYLEMQISLVKGCGDILSVARSIRSICVKVASLFHVHNVDSTHGYNQWRGKLRMRVSGQIFPTKVRLKRCRLGSCLTERSCCQNIEAVDGRWLQARCYTPGVWARSALCRLLCSRDSLFIEKSD